MVLSGIDGAADIETVAAELAQHAATIDQRVADVVRWAGQTTTATAMVLSPVDTGAMRTSIGMDFQAVAGGAEVVVGPTVHYAPYVEYGTSRMSPQPFMHPAQDRTEPHFVRAMGEIADPFGGAG